MRLDPSVRRRLWWQNQFFMLLFALVIGLLAWLSARYPLQADWTANGRNTLSAASQTLLASMDGPVQVTAYVREQPALRDAIARVIGRYQRYKPDLILHFANPDLLPDRTRELNITQEGELYVEYRERGEKLQQLSEQALSQTLQRLSRQERVALFLDGHGERNPLGIANHDLGTFGRELEKIGIQPRPFDLALEVRIPADAAALVIAGPRTPLPPGAVEAILEYVQQGGNLLWLRDPDEPAVLQQPLAAVLGIAFLPGVVVDPGTPSLGIKNPAFIPIADYGPHPITEKLRAPALLPQAVALILRPAAGWTATVLLESQARSWTETGPPDGPLRFDPDSAEWSGPLTVGVALSRPRPDAAPPQQRVVVIGDGDFLSNTYLGNGVNLELGLNIFNWLTVDEAPILIPPRTAPDPNLNLSADALALMAVVFLIGLPGILLASGGLIWFRRRRR